MNLKVNSKYMLWFEINKNDLTYNATILECDGVFVTFEDKFGETYTYNLSSLKQAREIRE